MTHVTRFLALVIDQPFALPVRNRANLLIRHVFCIQSDIPNSRVVKYIFAVKCWFTCSYCCTLNIAQQNAPCCQVQFAAKHPFFSSGDITVCMLLTMHDYGIYMRQPTSQTSIYDLSRCQHPHFYLINILRSVPSLLFCCVSSCVSHASQVMWFLDCCVWSMQVCTCIGRRMKVGGSYI